MMTFAQNYLEPYCVPCGLKGIIQYFNNISPSIEELIEKLGTTKNGTSLENVKPVLHEHGLKLRRIALKRVKEALKRRNPVMITYMSGIDEAHFSVIKGIYNKGSVETVILNDTTFGNNYELPMETLELLIKLDESWIREVYV